MSLPVAPSPHPVTLQTLEDGTEHSEREREGGGRKESVKKICTQILYTNKKNSVYAS